MWTFLVIFFIIFFWWFLGLRTNFALDVLELQATGLEPIGTWSVIDSLNLTRMVEPTLATNPYNCVFHLLASRVAIMCTQKFSCALCDGGQNLNFLDWTTMVFCFQNYSDLLWEKIVLVIKCLQSRICKFIQTVKVQTNFWNRICLNLFLEVSQI